MNHIKAVIFDLDGVITDTAEFHYLAWKKIADELNVYFNEEMNESLKGIDRMHSLEIILKGSDKQYANEEKIKLAERKNNYYKELIKNMSPKDLLPGAVDLLEDLRRQNIKVGLASVSKNAFSVVDSLKVSHLFDYIVDAATIQKGKPDPEIFLKASQNLDVEPSYCIGVEDAIAGIESIKSAGMLAVGVGDPTVLNRADFVIKTLLEFDLDRYTK